MPLVVGEVIAMIGGLLAVCGTLVEWTWTTHPLGTCTEFAFKASVRLGDMKKSRGCEACPPERERKRLAIKAQGFRSLEVGGVG